MSRRFSKKPELSFSEQCDTIEKCFKRGTSNKFEKNAGHGLARTIDWLYELGGSLILREGTVFAEIDSRVGSFNFSRKEEVCGVNISIAIPLEARDD